MKTGILGEKRPMHGYEGMNKFSGTEVEYGEYMLHGHLCYSSNGVCSLPFAVKTQWFSLSVCQDGVFSTEGIPQCHCQQEPRNILVCTRQTTGRPSFGWEMSRMSSSGRDNSCWIKAAWLHPCVFCLCHSTDHGPSFWTLCNYPPNEAEGGKGQEITQTSFPPAPGVAHLTQASRKQLSIEWDCEEQRGNCSLLKCSSSRARGALEQHSRT